MDEEYRISSRCRLSTAPGDLGPGLGRLCNPAPIDPTNHGACNPPRQHPSPARFRLGQLRSKTSIPPRKQARRFSTTDTANRPTPRRETNTLSIKMVSHLPAPGRPCWEGRGVRKGREANARIPVFDQHALLVSRLRYCWNEGVGEC